MELLYPKVALLLTFWRTFLLFPTVSVTIHAHQQCKSISFSPHPCQHLLLLSLDMWLGMLSIFSCVCWSSVCLLWKNVYSGSLLNQSVHFLMLTCISSFHILYINHLLGIPFANTLSRSICGLLFLLIVFFAMQKLFSLMKFQLFIFLFLSLLEDTYPKI